MQNLRGTPFHGEFSSADASAMTELASRFSLFGANSNVVIVLGANDIVVITDVIVTVGAVGLVVQIYDGGNNVVDAGEMIVKVNLVPNTAVYPDLTIGHYCQAATYPKCKSSVAGQVDVTINGTIVTVNP